MPAMPPSLPAAGATAAVNPISALTGLINALKPDDGAKGIQAMQPGMVEAVRHGVFGDAFSGFLTSSSHDVFQNQNPLFLASLNVEPFMGFSEGTKLAGMFINPGAESSSVPWFWIIGAAVIVFLVMRRR